MAPTCGRSSTARSTRSASPSTSGGRKSWRRGFRVYTITSIEGTQLLLEAWAGRQTRDFTFVADAAATRAAGARETPGRVYNTGGGSYVELIDVFELIRRVTGRSVTTKPLDPQKGDMRETSAGDFARAPGSRVRTGGDAEGRAARAVRMDEGRRPALTMC